MINLLLYRKDKSSCLIFKDFCSGDILSSMKPGCSSSFCINNLSFSVMYSGDLYLCSPVLDKRKTSTYLESNCKILNDLFDFNFQILNGRFFIRKDWIANHSKGTIFGKFNRKKDYIFNGKVIKVSRDCKIKSNIQCEVMKYLIILKKLELN